MYIYILVLVTRCRYCLRILQSCWIELLNLGLLGRRLTVSTTKCIYICIYYSENNIQYFREFSIQRMIFNFETENFFKTKSLPTVGLELLNLGLLGRSLIHSTTKFLLRE